jgi:hypothetical protein
MKVLRNMTEQKLNVKIMNANIRNELKAFKLDNLKDK